MEDQGGDLRKVRDDARRLLDRIDTRLLERQEEQDSKQREQVITRLLRASGIAVMLGLVWGWLRGHQREVVAAAATVAAGSVAVLGPTGVDDAGVEPSPAGPPPAGAPPAGGEGVPVTVTIQTAEPSPEVTSAAAPVEPHTHDVAPHTHDAEPPATLTMVEPQLVTGTSTPSPTATPTPTPTPTPTATPSPTPTLPPGEEGGGEVPAGVLCLDLDQRPVVGLGGCIREMLGVGVD